MPAIPGFNVQMPKSDAPFQMLSPELLAQLAAAGFRPPQGMGGPGLPGAMGGAPGFSMADGMAGLGAGMGMLGGMGDLGAAYGRTRGDADLGGYGASPVDPMGGNPNAQPVEVFNPSGAASSWRNLWGLF